LTIVLLEHFHVAAGHRFDGEPLNLRRTAGFSLPHIKIQYRAIDNLYVNRPVQTENSVNMSLPMEDARRIFASCGWRGFALHALLLNVLL
jgi:hypothetical protein